MDLELTAQQQDFRRRLRNWLHAELPRWREQRGASENDASEHAARLEWERTVFEAGWAGPSWPEEYGGLGLSVMEQLLYYEEMAAADAPEEVNRVGIRILGPTLIDAGSEAQRRRYLPPILRAEEVWCQGFSEPEAGSDLASVRTTAIPSRTGFTVNGSKIWTTNAHIADFMFALVRTDPEAPKHAGLSYLIIDMSAPGVTVQPIRDLTGGSEFNEVFLDDVQVPGDNLVGELHHGWDMAGRSLGYERTLNIASRIVRVARQVSDLATQIRQSDDARSEAYRELLARSFVDVQVMRQAAYRSVTGDGNPAVLGAMLKLHWSEAHQRMLEDALELAGDTGHLIERGTPGERWMNLWLKAHSETIYAGTSEILRNVVAQRGLGLPREKR